MQLHSHFCIDNRRWYATGTAVIKVAHVCSIVTINVHMSSKSTLYRRELLWAVRGARNAVHLCRTWWIRYCWPGRHIASPLWAYRTPRRWWRATLSVQMGYSWSRCTVSTPLRSHRSRSRTRWSALSIGRDTEQWWIVSVRCAGVGLRARIGVRIRTVV